MQVVAHALQAAVHGRRVGDGVDREPLLGEIALEQVPQAQVVVDNQDLLSLWHLLWRLHGPIVAVGRGSSLARCKGMLTAPARRALTLTTRYHMMSPPNAFAR